MYLYYPAFGGIWINHFVCGFDKTRLCKTKFEDKFSYHPVNNDVINVVLNLKKGKQTVEYYLKKNENGKFSKKNGAQFI